MTATKSIAGNIHTANRGLVTNTQLTLQKNEEENVHAAITHVSSLKPSRLSLCNVSPPPQLFNFDLLFFLPCLKRKKSPIEALALLTLRMFFTRHERQDGFCVVVGLLFTGCTRVFAVVGQLIHPSQVTDGVAKGERRWTVK